MGKKGGNKNRPKKPNQPDSTQQPPKALAPVPKSQEPAVLENPNVNQVNLNNQNVNPNPVDGIQIVVNNNEDKEEKKQEVENTIASSVSNANSSTEEAEPQNQEKELNKMEELKKVLNYVTVLDDSSNFNVKFPLKNKWTFWFDKPSPKDKSGSNWGDHLEKIYTFEYIEDFWRLYNNIEPVSRLANQSNYHLFKEGIVPKWEDPMNENGGRWMCNIDKSTRQLDEYFLKAMLACIGEQITSNDDEICGVVVSRKHSEDRLALWCYSTPDESSVTKKCGIRFKELLAIPQETKLFFQSAKDGKAGARAIPSASNYIL